MTRLFRRAPLFLLLAGVALPCGPAFAADPQARLAWLMDRLPDHQTTKALYPVRRER